MLIYTATVGCTPLQVYQQYHEILIEENAPAKSFLSLLKQVREGQNSPVSGVEGHDHTMFVHSYFQHAMEEDSAPLQDMIEVSKVIVRNRQSVIMICFLFSFQLLPDAHTLLPLNTC